MSDSDTIKRNLPSWMSSREKENDDSEKSKQSRNNGKSTTDQNASATSSATSDSSKLMEGVVFSLSGFVNPERGILRSQMLEMGAEYKPDWNSNCTLLVCAFSNTPKFRQVKAEGGTIISKDWISECHNQKKLVDIEPFLLHAGEPWRRQNISHEAREDVKLSTSDKPLKKEEKNTHPKKTCSSSKIKSCISPSKAKKWAVEDLKRTISWLGIQDEKPEPGVIKKIAAEGILTCLQDAIDALKQGQHIQKITEQWACLPRVVDELAMYDRINNEGRAKKDLSLVAMACKHIYELEFLNMEHEDIVVDKKSPPSHVSKKVNKREKMARGDASDDSDATVEMNEEEIDQAYNSIVCSL